MSSPQPVQSAPSPRTNLNGGQLVIRALCAALAYAVIGYVGLLLALPPGYASPFFPASGLAVALVLLYGRGILPGVGLGSALINLATAYQHGSLGLQGALVSLGLGCGAALQAWFAAVAVTRVVGDRWKRLETERDVVRMLLAAGPVACVISATIGHAILVPIGIIAMPEAFLSWWHWWLGDTIGVVIFTPMTLTVFLRAASPWRERVVVVLAPMLVTLALIASIFVGVSRAEDRRLRESIADHGQEVVQSLERRLVAHQEALASLKRLLEVMPDMTFEEFEYFTRNTVSANRDIFALSYNPCARPETRERIERFFAEKGPKPDYRIMERDANKQLRPAGERELYVSVGFIAPLEGNLPAIGFDINSEPLRHDAIDRAIRTGGTTVTAPLRLVQESQPRVGVLVLTPAFLRESTPQGDPAGSLFAFAVGVFKIDEMVKLAAGPYLRPDLVLRINDPMAPAEQPTLFESDGDKTGLEAAYAWSSSIKMADRVWNVEVIPTASYLRSARSWLAFVVATVGLLFAALLQVMLLSMTGRTAVIRRTVDEQTIELKVAKEVAEASQGRLLSLTEAAQDAILMIDPKGRVAFWNPAAERILGYTPDEALGHDLHDLLAPERYHAAFRENFGHFQKSGQGNVVGTTVELRARCKDGREIPVSLSLSSVLLDRSWHAVGILRDISDLKRHEAELLEAKEAAETATIAKSRFLANMSHEIRTPMNGIIGMTGLLLETDLTEEQRLYANVVRSSGDLLLDQVNEILDFSKIEAKKVSLEQIDFDFPALLEEVCAAMARRASERALELICDPDLEIPQHLRGDPGRLRQIVGNLVGNALKFTHEGEVIVRAAVIEESPGDVVIRVSVHDTGIGIPGDRLDLLFEKFSQIDASTTRQYGGTGLGLAISKQLVELMGGEIGVTSEPGRGSEFWCTVRLARTAEPSESSPDEARREPPAEGLKGARVLVVDDNAASRAFLVRHLTACGLLPSEVRDGPSALSVLFTAQEQGTPFSFALIDARMPGMSGEELGRAIRANSRLDALHMVLMVSLGALSDTRRFVELGFAATIWKPIRRHDLQSVLSHLVVEQATAAPSSVAPRAAAATQTQGASTNRGRVLLVEDNMTNQLVALRLLERLGVSAQAVANGLEAVNTLASLPFDLVLMDVQMPEMDGCEATARVRANDPPTLDPSIPIVALTAHATVEDRERCFAAGMSDYLSKPVNRQALEDVLERWLPVRPVIFERAELMATVSDDEDLVKEILQQFLEESPRILDTLETHLQAGDTTGAGRMAHGLMGGAASIGGSELRTVALEMENAATEGNLEGAKAVLPELRAAFERLKAAIISGE